MSCGKDARVKLEGLVIEQMSRPVLQARPWEIRYYETLEKEHRRCRVTAAAVANVLQELGLSRLPDLRGRIFDRTLSHTHVRADTGSSTFALFDRNGFAEMTS